MEATSEIISEEVTTRTEVTEDEKSESNGSTPSCESSVCIDTATTVESVKTKKQKPPLLDLNFVQFQQMQLRSEISLDDFDDDGVPYSPNLHKMWVRRCVRQNADGDIQATVKKAGFHGFVYKPCPSGVGGDVVYDDGQGSLQPVAGTWILNNKDEIVSGPGLTASLALSNQSRPELQLLGRDNQSNAASTSTPPEERRRTRNRCYSDGVPEEDTDGTFAEGDSGIGLEDEDLTIATTPSQEEFKPPLISTPAPRSSSSLRKAIQLDEEEEDAKILLQLDNISVETLQL